jgi:choline dehydrogenase-like flavoprotein
MPLLQVKEFWPDLVLGGAFFSPGHLAVVLADNWPVTHDRMNEIGRMACYYVGVRGTGRGRVRPSRLEAGRTDIRYELSDEDIWNLSRGVARLATLLLEGGAVEVLPAVHGLPAIRDEVEAVRWLDDRLDGRACSLTTVHAFSTCPVGERRDRCAADSFGRLHGFDNVYVNDASLVPDSPGVNPQGTIMTFARRNALHFCHEHPA